MRSIGQIKAQIGKIDDRVSTLKSQRSDIDNEIKVLQNRKKELNKKVNNNPDNARKVSDHAVVRYMEHILGMNIKDLEQQIMSDSRADRVNKNGVVVTVKPKKEKRKKN